MSKIVVKDIKKHFGSTTALDGVSFELQEGKILGLLGPNGAGKTTLVNILSTLLVPDGGSASVAGLDVVKDDRELRKIIGLAGQFAAVDENLTGRENLEMVGRLYHLPRKEVKTRVREVLDRISLTHAADRYAKTYSGGMRRRLDLGASLLYRPEVLFLDEPTTGLDPKTRKDIWTLIREMVDDGTTLLLTTQYLEEADELADTIVVIDSGKIVARGTASELKASVGQDKIVIELEDVKSAKQAIEVLKKSGISEDIVQQNGGEIVSYIIDNGVKDLEKSLSILREGGVDAVHVNLTQPSLDDVFLSLTDGDINA